MPWTKNQIRHNASVLYNQLCSEDANKVYVDKEGHLQFDSRSFFLRWVRPLGDSTRKKTDEVAIRTLRRVLNVIEAGLLNPDKIVIQERIPCGLFMSGKDDVEESYEAMKQSMFKRSSALVTKDKPVEKKWIDHTTFARNISNSSHFNTWMPCGKSEFSELTYPQQICRKVTVLTQMIMHGKESYISTCGDDGYDQSDNES